jgi:hypothetical protein
VLTIAGLGPPRLAVDQIRTVDASFPGVQRVRHPGVVRPLFKWLTHGQADVTDAAASGEGRWHGRQPVDGAFAETWGHTGRWIEASLALTARGERALIDGSSGGLIRE